MSTCLESRRNIDAPEDNYMTRVDAVLACGEARRGYAV